jgi:hypothetical protein
MIGVITGCIVQSFHPLFATDECLFEERFLGKWIGRNGTSSWEFARKNDNLYKLIISVTESDSSGTINTKMLYFTALIGRINNQYFLDILPDLNESNGEWSICKDYGFYLIPVHSFSKLKIEGDTLSVSSINYNWLEKGIKKNKIKIKHEKVNEGGILLTASTKELQKFISKYSNNKEAFESGNIYVKER